MENKRLIKYIKSYLNDKGYNVNIKGYLGTRCIYEREDIYLIVFINSSTVTKSQYFEYNYIIKGIKEIDINNIKLQDYAMYGPIRIGYFESEKYTEETIQEELDSIYNKYLKPIMNEGLEYICKQKHYMKPKEERLRKETIEYLKKYKKEHKIKTSKERIYGKQENIGMEKKILINYIKAFLEEKGFDVSRKWFGGPKCIYERDDMYLVVYINRSSYSDLQYYEFNYIIKGLRDTDINNTVSEDWAMYTNIRISYFEPEEYIIDTLQKHLEEVYEKYLAPIINGGIDFICTQNHFMNPHDDLTKPNSLEYLKKYKEEHNIKTSKKMIYIK